MRILVAGGAGYIGSVTVEQLVAAGHEVAVLDNLSRGHREAVADGAELHVADLANEEEVDRIFAENRFEAVMHFCASSQVGESVQEPLGYYDNNLANGFRLVRAMLKHKVESFIFSSTAAIFGEPETMPIEEDTLKAPTNPYGRTKLYFEGFLQDCDAAYGLKSVCLRYFNAAGASENFGEDHSPETHLIPIILQVAAGRRPSLSIFGDDYKTRDGSCIRDYIHVIDLAQAHILALESIAGTGRSEVYNLGNGEGYSVFEVLDAAKRVTGTDIAYQVSPRRAGDPASLVASSEKIRKQLGWKPKYPQLEPIIESAWKWMQQHPRGYSS